MKLSRRQLAQEAETASSIQTNKLSLNLIGLQFFSLVIVAVSECSFGRVRMLPEFAIRTNPAALGLCPFLKAISFWIPSSGNR